MTDNTTSYNVKYLLCGLRLFCSSFSQGLLIISQSEIQVPSRSKWEEMEPAEDKLSE